jgi:hypothetical protein
LLVHLLSVVVITDDFIEHLSAAISPFAHTTLAFSGSHQHLTIIIQEFVIIVFHNATLSSREQ